MKIYLASSWENKYQPHIVGLLRCYGHEVYDFRNPNDKDDGFSWSDIDPNWEKWSFDNFKNALNHPIAVNGFNKDFDAMKWADCCVLLLPSGRSAHTEAGFMKGAGKKVIVCIPQFEISELMYKIYDEIVSNPIDLIHSLNKLKI